MSGEQLLGAKQNRVLNISIMVASNSDLPIRVSCAEAGRWRYQSRKFASSGTASQKAKISSNRACSSRTNRSTRNCLQRRHRRAAVLPERDQVVGAEQLPTNLEDASHF